MNKFTDQNYLKNDQYRDASNLNARMEVHRRFSTNPQGWYAWVFDTLETLPQQAQVLELGCGTGAMWADCPERIPAGWTLTLSDLSGGMLDEAWRNLVVLGRSFKFEQIDAQSISYPDETFDIVIANHMLYHVPNRPKALAEIRRVLKPGGILIATTVGENHLKELNAWLARVSMDENFKPFSAEFTLENGGAQLQPLFSQIECLRYDDNLRITDLDLLVTYLRSAIRASEISDEELTALRYDLEQELRDKGELFVTKDSGLFKAVKEKEQS
jgi:ubiquinone/menaquinone biosynthesis C-methylase UbiE